MTEERMLSLVESGWPAFERANHWVWVSGRRL
ncbi:hypothetical protein L914_05625 [Phytophthora nicotianae]|uniref:Uncharacterized protein n=1 Tax=Phytophthora nicotianae TaxID=4792 RepID=W2NRQ2_PHYNI|nr:hypothetical protein L914_05625 [Phytophthora nicotianae]